jgi:hypothetical protein
MAETITKLAAIKQFFEADGGKKVEMSELVAFKKVDPDGIQELGQLAAAALGKELASA